MKTLTFETLTPGILYIDQREPIQFAEKIAELTATPIEIRTLETGDFVMEDVAIERKTVDDFCGSIMSKKSIKDGKIVEGRLFNQADRMRRQFRKKYILVTGNLCDRTSQIHIHALLGGLARFYVEDGQVMTGLSDEDDFVYFLLKLLEKDGKLTMFKPNKKR